MIFNTPRTTYITYTGNMTHTLNVRISIGKTLMRQLYTDGVEDEDDATVLRESAFETANWLGPTSGGEG